MEEKKPVVYLDEVLSENDVFAQMVTINYDDKLIIYSRGVEKTEIIDGEDVLRLHGFARVCLFGPFELIHSNYLREFVARNQYFGGASVVFLLLVALL